MKRAIKVIKAFWIINSSGNNWSSVVFIIFALLESIISCAMLTTVVLDYVNKGTTTGFIDIINMLIFIMIMSNMASLNDPSITPLKGKITINNPTIFLIQAPLLKKDIIKAKVVIFQISNFPFLLVVLYFIALNVFVSRSMFISAYSVLLILIYCIWTVISNISIGFSTLNSKKYKRIGYLCVTLLLVPFMCYILLIFIRNGQPATLVTEQNMFNGLGPMFIPILKACSHLGSGFGIIIIIVSYIISYFLAYFLPLKIMEKEGI